jgi:hypothetical protein
MAQAVGSTNAEMLRLARKNPNEATTVDVSDFPVVSTGDATYVKNSNGGIHTVPSSWVTIAEDGIVRVRGYGNYTLATATEIASYHTAQGLHGAINSPVRVTAGNLTKS